MSLKAQTTLLIFFYNKDDADCLLRTREGLERGECFAFKRGKEGELLRLAEGYSGAFGIRSVALTKEYKSSEDLVEGHIRGIGKGLRSVSLRVYDPCGGRLAEEEARVAELAVERAGLKIDEVEPEMELKAYYHEGAYYAVVWELSGLPGRICATGTRAAVVYDGSEEAMGLIYSLVSQGASEVYVILSSMDPSGIRWFVKELWNLRKRAIASRVYVVAAPGGSEEEFASKNGLALIVHGKVKPGDHIVVPDEIIHAVHLERGPIKKWSATIQPKGTAVVEVKGGPVDYHAALDSLLKKAGWGRASDRSTRT